MRFRRTERDRIHHGGTALGYTVVGYITQYRIHQAMELLKDCRYKVYEVAEMVGYRDVTYFGSTFKKVTGMSPSDYQDRCR